ncbi:uncharacterized protein LOC128395470 [Panonychus citri]|uniref:uncharacterized protein LOC128395470 n=1 Tax=Panonychus citri TaxID=50023 RepID=UPI002307FEED|nr:uncharacterized protein LOC128395470 [Panonychus citri]
MVKRKYLDDDGDLTIKRMCTNQNLIPLKSVSTLSLILREGAKKLWSPSSVNCSDSLENNKDVKCRICKKKLILKPDSTIRCNFCEHSICDSCLINCGQCKNQFCSFCAVNVYSPVGDLGRCLSCF